jgi:hypothetical protein
MSAVAVTHLRDSRHPLIGLVASLSLATTERTESHAADQEAARAEFWGLSRLQDESCVRDR